MSVRREIYEALGDDRAARTLMAQSFGLGPAPDPRWGMVERPEHRRFSIAPFVCQDCRRGAQASEPTQCCDYCGGKLLRNLPLGSGPSWKADRPLRRPAAWVAALWAFVSRDNGINCSELAREQKLSRTSSRQILRTLRAQQPVASPPMLAGPVEVDEASIPTASGNAIVIIATESRNGHVRAVRAARLPRIDADSLTRFVSHSVRPGATVITDHFPGYDGLTAAGYDHRPREASTSGDPGKIAVGGPRYIATALRRWLLAQHHGAVREINIQPYLDEFCFRYAIRNAEHPPPELVRLWPHLSPEQRLAWPPAAPSLESEFLQMLIALSAWRDSPWLRRMPNLHA